MAGKTVAVLGGGVGGLVSANRLRKLLSREHRIVLIDRNVWHSFAPAYPAVMLGQKVARQVSRDLRSLERKGIEFIAAEITGIDLSGKTVRFDGQELAYDYLIVSRSTFTQPPSSARPASRPTVGTSCRGTAMRRS